MARFPVPVFQFANSAGQPYAGGSLGFYISSTSTPLETYPTPADAVAGTNANPQPVPLNSAGWPATAIFLQNRSYKVVLKDSSGNTIWTADPVSGTDFASVPIWATVVGDPNGQLAGTAASSGVLPSIAWDRQGQILYVCTSTGTSSTAIWTAINAQSATAVVTPPQGYLSLNPAASGTILAADVVAGTAVYYTPFMGNLVPIYNGSRLVPTEFAELTLTLAAQHLASQIYDVFVFSNSGTPTIVTGPAWTTPTAGAGARGTGASTTQLTRLNGYWVNAVSITGRNGSTTYTIGANLATYVGSLFMDGTNGQITCHRTWGASRKWGVWNASNRQPIDIKCGDSTASWQYQTNTTRPSRDQTTNSLTIFAGLAEEVFDLGFAQHVDSDTVENPIEAEIGIGFNSTTTSSGMRGRTGENDVGGSVSGGSRGTPVAKYVAPPSLGINVITALETAPATSGTNTFYGTEARMLLSARWRG